jgi:predicted lactoylglutathione lyase
MSGSIWINLPSKNLLTAKKFFTAIGFEMNSAHNAPHMVSMFVGENRLIVNLFDSELFQKFIGGHMVTAPSESSEVLFSIGAGSPEEVDSMARKVESAGGVLYSKPQYTDGWMYGFGFIDTDGHRWNSLYMDMSKMPS